MNREMVIKMKNSINILTMLLLAFVVLMGAAYADPIQVTNVNIKEAGNDYMVIVSLENADVSTGIYTELKFTVEELGTTKNLGVVRVDSNDTILLTYNLRELTDSYNLLRKGNAYQLTVSTDTDSMTQSFFFGTERSTDGLSLILENVRVNSEEVTHNEYLQVMNGEQLSVALRFTALENFDNARFMVFIEGYEHSPLVGTTEIFSVREGVAYVKDVRVNLPADMRAEQNYKLRIAGANDLSGITYKEYTLFVDTQRHRVDILDLVMTPSSGVEPGQNMIANVRLRNMGQRAQDSVKVVVEVESLGISESSYLSNLNPNNVATSDDMLLFIPRDAKAGSHEAVVRLVYNNGYTQTVDSYTLNVLSPEVVPEQNLLISFEDNLKLKGNSAETIELVVANPNRESKPITVVPLENTWADVEISPSLAMVQGGSSETFRVSITPRSGIEGEKSLVLLVKEGNRIVSEVTVNSHVEKAPDSDAINWVNIALIVLLIIAIIILLALVIAIARRRNDDSGREISTTEEYY